MEANGQSEMKRCAYCGKLRPIEEMQYASIYCRAWGGRRMRVVEEWHWYCKDAPCHSNDQCAHED